MRFIISSSASKHGNPNQCRRAVNTPAFYFQKALDFYIVLRYTQYIEVRYIVAHKEVGMEQHIKKVYVPMTETAFYILLCLKDPTHGYGIVQKVEQLTDGAIRLAPGTMYGSLSKMEKDGVIRFVKEEEKRKIYQITPLGSELLEIERKRIERLYRISKEAL